MQVLGHLLSALKGNYQLGVGSCPIEDPMNLILAIVGEHVKIVTGVGIFAAKILDLRFRQCDHSLKRLILLRGEDMNASESQVDEGESAPAVEQLGDSDGHFDSGLVSNLLGRGFRVEGVQLLEHAAGGHRGDDPGPENVQPALPILLAGTGEQVTVPPGVHLPEMPFSLDGALLDSGVADVEALYQLAICKQL